MNKALFKLLVLCVLIPSFASGSIRLASLFTDHMVLQRDMPIPVWGEGNPGSRVAVQYADQTHYAVVDSEGKWQISLDPIEASFESRSMRVTASDARDTPIVLEDVLVGEVWICSGQSNMEWHFSRVEETKKLSPLAKNIRTFEVKRTVAFEEQAYCEGEWVEQHPSSAVAFGFAHFLHQHTDVPVGIILTCWGSSGLEAWMPRDMVETVPHFKQMMDDFDTDVARQNKVRAILEGPKPWSKRDDIYLRRQDNLLYNAMMAPLAPYAVRGLVWYQGERNTKTIYGMPEQGPWYVRNSGMLKYGDVLGKWIQRYRQEWQQDDMYFLVVMLPGYFKQMSTGPQTGAESPIAHSWAWMRESQMKILDLAHTGIPNTVDLGDAKNIHPRDKFPISERLALLAARDVYGLDVVAEGPIFHEVESAGDSLLVHFKHAEGLKTIDGEAPTGFWICDTSAVWVPAQAKIDGTHVVLTAEGVAEPLYVRYAFAGKPKVNLVNEANLPAYPFRTDTFAP